MGNWDADTGLWQGAFAGQAQFAQMVCAALQTAHERNWSEIVVCDADFAAWPFAYKNAYDLLNQWSMTGRRFTIVARDFGHVQRNQHRFVQWRKQWAHIVTACVNQEVSDTDFPSLFWSPEWVCQRVNTEYSTGHAGSEGWRQVAVREQLDELLAKSSPAFPANVLGL